MVMIGKNGKVSILDAVFFFIVNNLSYLIIIYIRELYSWLSGTPISDILTIKSYHALVFFASLLYFAFMLAWCYLVVRSFKSWK